MNQRLSAHKEIEQIFIRWHPARFLTKFAIIKSHMERGEDFSKKNRRACEI